MVDEPTGSTPPILAIHGVSSQRRLWDWLREVAPELSLIAPDLRGRGDSVEVSGPSSISRHVDDMIAVLDAMGHERVHLCGMSMGGFVAVELAHRFPERVHSLVLVDGGAPMTPPPGLSPDQLPAVFKDRLGRLSRVWSSVEEYRDYFVGESAPLLDPADPVLLGYLAHDLRDGRVRLSPDAVVEDATGVFFGAGHWDDLAVPTRLVYAEWSVGKDSPPAYSVDRVHTFGDRLPALTSTRLVPGVDHAAIIMSSTGAEAVAEELRSAVA